VVRLNDEAAKYGGYRFMTNSTMNMKALYFSSKLSHRMKALPDYPCTLIEAPVGYGKTTAVREFLTVLDATVIWQSVYDQNDTEFWAGFCKAISKIDTGCGDHLKKIGMPKESLMKREAMSCLEKIPILKTTFLVIDDYHFVKAPEVSDFLELFVRNMPARLHLIVISRTAVFKNSGELHLKGMANHIGTQMLQFSPSDIKEYYHQCGIRINDTEQSELYSRTEGWVSALYLLACEYELHGSFILTKSMSELIYHAVYEPLDDELKAFLQAVCQFDKFSMEQAEYVWNSDAGKLLKKLMEYNAFITLDHDSGNYTFHSIFSSCIREQFKKLPEKMKKETATTRLVTAR
jgi:LuxR family maltose regulon positive regulatory protein